MFAEWCTSPLLGISLCSAASWEGKIQRKMTAIGETLKDYEREDLALCE